MLRVLKNDIKIQEIKACVKVRNDIADQLCSRFRKTGHPDRKKVTLTPVWYLVRLAATVISPSSCVDQGMSPCELVFRYL